MRGEDATFSDRWGDFKEILKKYTGQGKESRFEETKLTINSVEYSSGRNEWMEKTC